MSVFIKEKGGMDLSQFIGESIYLRTGRSNNVIIDDKIFIHDVRAIHFVDGDGSHCELITQRSPDDHNEHTYVYNVSKIIVEAVYWSQKFDYDSLNYTLTEVDC